MTTRVYSFTALNGGGTGALDKYPESGGPVLATGDMAIGIVGTDMYSYRFNASSSAAESVPTIIAPDSGTGRWELITMLSNITYANQDLRIAASPTFANLTSNAIINAVTGYRINGTAVSGNYLRGNGTNFVSSTIQASDVPTLNQSTTGNANTATLAATITAANTTDTSCSIAMFDSPTGDMAIKTNTKLTYNATTGFLAANGFSIAQSVTDVAFAESSIISTMTLTANGAFSPIAFDSYAFAVIPTGVTNSGSLINGRFTTYINSASYQGTLNTLIALQAYAGIGTCGAGGIVTNVYGLQAIIYGSDADGTMTNAYAGYFSINASVSAITNRYGILISAMAGTGASAYGISIESLSGTQTNKYGISINAISGASTINYGLKIDNVSGATDTSFSIFTGLGVVQFGGTLYLQNSNVSHGMTAITRDDAYAQFTIKDSSYGGLAIRGFSDSDAATALALYGIIGSADPTDTTPAVILCGGKKNGTNWQALGASETILKVQNYSSVYATMLGNGYLALGGSHVPAYPLHVTGAMYNYLSATDADPGYTYFNSKLTMTTNGALIPSTVVIGNSALEIPTGVTNSGAVIALNVASYISNANYMGTLAKQYGIAIFSGIYSCGVGGTITESRGLTVSIYNNDADGTITTSYGIYVDNSATVGANTNRYGIAVAAFAGTGTLGIGMYVGAMSGTQAVKYGLWINPITGASALNAGIRLGSVTGGTENYAIYTESGVVRFGDAVSSQGNISSWGSYYLCNTSVDHGMTDIFATTVYANASNLSATAGGLNLYGLSDTDFSAIMITGIIGSADPTDTTAAFIFRGGKKNGTTWQALASAETVFQFRNYTTNIITVLGNGYVGLGSSKTAPATALDVDGTITATLLKMTSGAVAGKIPLSDANGLLSFTDYFGTFTNYSSTSTVVGWSSFTSKAIHYVTLGNFTLIWFRLEGTSNSTSVSFTLPSTPVTISLNVPCRTVDNGTGVPGIAAVAASTTVNCYATYAGGSWTASGSKIVNGFFIYKHA